MSAIKANTQAGGKYDMLLMQNNSVDTDPSGEFSLVDQLSVSPVPNKADQIRKLNHSYLRNEAGSVQHAISMQVLPSKVENESSEERYKGCGHKPTSLSRGKDSQLRSQADFVNFIHNTSKHIG